MKSNSTRAPIIIPILLVVIGVILLLKNYLLLESIEPLQNINLLNYWPVILVLLGLQLLIRGDIGLTWQAQTFGITRGNVEAATLEASSGEIDVTLRALRREGRLIAGQYTARSRPNLTARSNHARLTMQRGQTWPFSLADWEIGLAKDLPWELLLSTHLGELDIDLRGLLVTQATFATGIGDVKVIASDILSVPSEEGDSISPAVRICSTLGNVTLVIPPDVQAVVRIPQRPLARIQIDESRFLMLEPGIYATLGYEQSVRSVNAEISSTLGTIRLM